MLFPWVGMFEQIHAADVFVHYDDVQFSKGSFTNRIQVKTRQGVRWLTVPLRTLHLGQRIADVQIQPISNWRGQHLELLARSLDGAPYFQDAIGIAEKAYSSDHATIGNLARASLLGIAEYFGLTKSTRFVDVSDLGISGSGSSRVLAIVKQLGGTSYVTGHGAARYLDHAAFESAGVDVEYIDYRRQSYPQLHGDFTPYVTALDLVANCGPQGRDFIRARTIPWRDFINPSRNQATGNDVQRS